MNVGWDLHSQTRCTGKYLLEFLGTVADAVIEFTEFDKGGNSGVAHMSRADQKAEYAAKAAENMLFTQDVRELLGGFYPV